MKYVTTAILDMDGTGRNKRPRHLLPNCPETILKLIFNLLHQDFIKVWKSPCSSPQLWGLIANIHTCNGNKIPPGTGQAPFLTITRLRENLITQWKSHKYFRLTQFGCTGFFPAFHCVREFLSTLQPFGKGHMAEGISGHE